MTSCYVLVWCIANDFLTLNMFQSKVKYSIFNIALLNIPNFYR